MHWKIKANIQNFISILPSNISYNTYYWIQRNFGGLRKVDPTKRLLAGVNTWKIIQEQGISPSGKIFFEVGTGRVPLTPLAYWLMGAEKTITIDLNPYLKEELIRDSLKYILHNQNEISELFGLLINEERFNAIVALAEKPDFSVTSFLEMCNINYIAPGDAASTDIPDNYIDFHTSYTVFEHIPSKIILDILKEGNRIIKTDGLFVHKIDYSDHFSHSDREINSINFLKYDDETWNKYAGNRYMYMNRLRHDDFLSLFSKADQDIISSKTTIDEVVKKKLSNEELILDEKFSSKNKDILSINGSWMITKQCNSNQQ